MKNIFAFIFITLTVLCTSNMAQEYTANYWLQKGDQFSENNSYDLALRCYEKAIEINPLEADAWNNKGKVLNQLNRTVDADDAFAKAIELGAKDSIRTNDEIVEEPYAITDTTMIAREVIAKTPNVVITQDGPGGSTGFGFDGTKGNITPRDLFLEKVYEDYGFLSGNGLDLPLRELCNNASHATGIIPAGRFAGFNLSRNEERKAYQLMIPFGPYKATFLTDRLPKLGDNIVINYSYDRVDGLVETYHVSQYSCWNYIMYAIQGSSNARYLSILITRFEGPSEYLTIDPDPDGWSEVPYSWDNSTPAKVKIDGHDGTLLLADPSTTLAPSRPLMYIYSYELNHTTFVKLISNFPEEAISLIAETLTITDSEDDVAAINESDPVYWCNKGSDLYRQYMYIEAIKAFDKAIKLNPNYADAWRALGFAFLDEENGKKYGEAFEAFDNAIGLNPNDSISWCNKGVALGMQGKRSEAIQYYDKAISLDSNYADAWRYKGIALYNLGKYEDAIEAYENALNLNPYDEEALDLKLKAEDKRMK